MATYRRTIRVRISEMRNAIRELERLKTSVGWFQGSTYEDGTPMATVAAINEFGSRRDNIPARPFMRPTISQRENEWADLAESGARALVRGRTDAQEMMGRIGFQAAGDVALTITNLWSPPLADATIDARRRKLADGVTIGSLRKPLVETGRLLDALTYEVEQN